MTPSSESRRIPIEVLHENRYIPRPCRTIGNSRNRHAPRFTLWSSGTVEPARFTVNANTPATTIYIKHSACSQFPDAPQICPNITQSHESPYAIPLVLNFDQSTMDSAQHDSLCRTASTALRSASPSILRQSRHLGVASVAQLAEQLTLNQRVQGSSPCGGISAFGCV